MKRLQIKFATLIIALLVILSPVTVYATEAETQDTPATEETLEEDFTPAPARTSAWPLGPGEIESESAVVMDYESGAIVYEKNPTEAHYPASITKVMTALVALENSSLDEKVTFSYNSVHSLEKGSSSISRDVDEIMTMEECIYGLLLESANECGNAIAEHISGTTEAFAELMNKKAKELGCVNTHFANPHGLHDDNHYTCAYDMALISRAAYDNPTFALITGTKSYTIPPTNKHEDPTPLNNHHAMLNYYRTNQYLYDYCVGGKTGYTSVAQGTLVTYAKKDGITLICVTMCGAGSAHYRDTRALFDYYFENLTTVPISDLSDNLTQFSSSSISRLLGKDEIPYELDLNAVITVPVNADRTKVTSKFIGSKDRSGDQMGHIEFSYEGKVVGEASILGKDVSIFPFKNVTSDEVEEEAENEYVVINIYRIVLIVLGSIVGLLLLGFIIFKTNNAISLARRKRIENRDPHKNMRRIKRRRQNRRTRER